MHRISLDWADFTYPWERRGFRERLDQVASKSAPVSVVYLSTRADSGTFRYRVFNMCESLETSRGVSATYFLMSEIRAVLPYFDRVDVLVVSRVLWSIELDEVLLQAAAHGVRTIYDVDDLVFDVRRVPTIINTIGAEHKATTYEYWFSYASRVFLAASYCDAYLTTTEPLAEAIRSMFDGTCRVVPNGLNAAQTAVSDQIWEAKRDGAAYDGDSLRMGYFSGTPSHNNDFASIAPELRRVLIEDQRVSLIVAGYLEVPRILEEFVDAGRIERHPLQNYLNLQALIACCDVNLIPLIVNDFTGAKSELKYFEAGIVGTPSVASRTPVFESAIVDGVDGFVAQAGDWQDRIRRIIDGPAVSNLAHAARAAAADRHSVQATRITLSRAIEEIVG